LVLVSWKLLDEVVASLQRLVQARLVLALVELLAVQQQLEHEQALVQRLKHVDHLVQVFQRDLLSLG
jgi:hypothetical protein